jgi:toxin ParE1/3/4
MGTYRLTEGAKADAYYNAFFDRFEFLAEQPLSYPAVDGFRAGYRRSLCGADSIYYRVQGEVVDIMAIIGQQDIDGWL